MKIVVIGGSGLIGSRVVAGLAGQGHQAVAASPSTGVNSVTGEGLAEAFAGTDVVVDVTNSPSFAPDAVREFFETSTGNLLAAEAKTRVGHHVALSVVGADRVPDSGYLRAKVAQEALIAAGPVPYSIVRATQFFEFIGAIADTATQETKVHVPPVSFQPIAADDVAAAVAEVAIGTPVNGIVDVAGPDRFRFDEVIREILASNGDPREVVTDPTARYFGALLGNDSLVPIGTARTGEVRLAQWLDSQGKGR
ncbi:SDR family oxidoreductase [Solwaraspora sp. WMMD1047]|uniref:SDR family oxidoreductase n=1 Tax=Solwaraspora sp. WMMD1047 TaxID=3016102 RepID=UPI0024177BED|nr:SDR family oxidoreductase [Solwaraspora sp. WMMD1047]MDG4828127.1 SDR family oxidoreductase [Solwaraspora sp. WMMD1047]